jgi:hypothetical protein
MTKFLVDIIVFSVILFVNLKEFCCSFSQIMKYDLSFYELPFTEVVSTVTGWKGWPFAAGEAISWNDAVVKGKGIVKYGTSSFFI